MSLNKLLGCDFASAVCNLVPAACDFESSDYFVRTPEEKFLLDFFPLIQTFATVSEMDAAFLQQLSDDPRFSEGFKLSVCDVEFDLKKLVIDRGEGLVFMACLLLYEQSPLEFTSMPHILRLITSKQEVPTNVFENPVLRLEENSGGAPRRSRIAFDIAAILAASSCPGALDLLLDRFAQPAVVVLSENGKSGLGARVCIVSDDTGTVTVTHACKDVFEDFCVDKYQRYSACFNLPWNDAPLLINHLLRGVEEPDEGASLAVMTILNRSLLQNNSCVGFISRSTTLLKGVFNMDLVLPCALDVCFEETIQFSSMDLYDLTFLLGSDDAVDREIAERFIGRCLEDPLFMDRVCPPGSQLGDGVVVPGLINLTLTVLSDPNLFHLGESWLGRLNQLQIDYLAMGVTRYVTNIDFDSASIPITCPEPLKGALKLISSDRWGRVKSVLDDWTPGHSKTSDIFVCSRLFRVCYENYQTQDSLSLYHLLGSRCSPVHVGELVVDWVIRLNICDSFGNVDNEAVARAESSNQHFLGQLDAGCFQHFLEQSKHCFYPSLKESIADYYRKKGATLVGLDSKNNPIHETTV